MDTLVDINTKGGPNKQMSPQLYQPYDLQKIMLLNSNTFQHVTLIHICAR